MSTLDWIVFGLYLVVLLGVGVLAGKRHRGEAGFLLAGRSMPWWAVGLSVMATQASAITFLGTTAQGATDGMRFAQFYLGLPIAMLILAFTLVPKLRAAKVTTVYELLEQRFDVRVRLATSVLFLVSRSLALGVVVYAPSLVLSLMMGWDTSSAILLVTVVAVAYTLLGGLAAVIWTDVLQMGLLLGGLALCVPELLSRLPEGMALGEAWDLATLSGRTRVLDLSFDPSEKYTLWSGLFGGTLVFLAYFGCDQSQAQRLLAARSLGHARRALALNGVAKIPLQLGILAVGVLLFVVGHYEPPELFLDPRTPDVLVETGQVARGAELEAEWDAAQSERRAAADAWRAAPDDPVAQAAYRASQTRVDSVTAAAGELQAGDLTNPLFLDFLLRALPFGLLGLVLAAVCAAAMSSMDSELNALATSTAVDLYERHAPGDVSEASVVRVSRWATLGWGVAAAVVALYADQLGSVIEAVNQLGSYAYGSLLGVFTLALGVPSARARGAFWGLLIGLAVVLIAGSQGLAWLWLNPLGAGVVIAVGWLDGRRAR
ncbi:MAG: hypothetical protein DHS20C15_26090 [Planctomycetota bacterium]|nr:MAG: hypothetical protein DHS20C15_26090 [Planctomycetota bacterium]